MAKHFHTKVISNGHVIEVYEYENAVWCQFESNGGRKKDEEGNPERLEEYQKERSRKARNNIRRLCLANFSEKSKFLTLTFKENETDVQRANRAFKKFIQRMRYRYGNFKYVAVIEFQERGAVHYHMMSDLPYVANKELNEIWGKGFVKITAIDHVDNVGAYMAKYMMKDVADIRLQGQKCYLTSKNLERPVQLVGKDAEQAIKALGLEQKKEVYSSCYPTEYLGEVTYREYNLKRDPK